MKSNAGNEQPRWSFLTNHARVLQAVAADPVIRLRDIASQAGVTERTAAQIVRELERVGYLTKTRNGRRNHYEIRAELSLRHPNHDHRTIGELIRFLEQPKRDQVVAGRPGSVGRIRRAPLPPVA